MNKLIYILITLICLGCDFNHKPDKANSGQESIKNEFKSLYSEPYKTNDFKDYSWEGDTATYYWNFIDKTNGLIENRLDTFVNQWFSYFMTKFNLENYSERYSGHESYRILWLRTFHDPIVFEIKNKETSVILSYKVSNGAGGYEFGELIKDTAFAIKAQDWIELQRLVQKSDFWNMKIPGCDGSYLIMEGQNKKGYHMVYRWGGQEIGECGKLMIELSGINIPEKEFY